MVQKKISNNYLIFSLAVVSWISALAIHQAFVRPTIETSKQLSATNINQNFLKFMALGNKRLISDILWIQTLMESDLERYGRKDLGSWMYLRFLSISSLDPFFYENYLYGGIYLSIVKDDLQGAADIYEKGLNYYPADYRLNYNAGFNYYFEMEDFPKGLTLLKKIQHHPKAPAGLKFVISKLLFETTNNYETTMEFLNYNFTTSQDPVIRNKMAKDMYALKADKDLMCLNAGRTDCSRLDADGERYIYRNGKWGAYKTYIPYKIHRLKSNHDRK